MNKTQETMALIAAVMQNNAVGDNLKVLHRKAFEVFRFKSEGGKSPLGAVNNNPGWYWVDRDSGLMIKAGENGRLYIKGSYKTGHEWVRSASTQVPGKWLGLDALRTLVGQYVMDGDKRAVTFVPLHVLAVRVWSDSSLRELFQKLMMEKLLCLHLGEDGNIAPYHYMQNKGFVRAEHNIKGLKGLRFPKHEEAKCVVHAIKDDEPGLMAFEDPSKLNERVVKIYANTDGVYVGSHRAIVLLSAPHCGNADLQEELYNAFCTGTAYSQRLFRMLGAVRCITKSLGGKMTIASPFTFEGFEDAVVANLSSWKGGLNMLLNHTGVMSIEEQLKYCEWHFADDGKADKAKLTTMALEELDRFGKIQRGTVLYRGQPVRIEYVEVMEEFYATNLYAMYGCQYKEADDDEQDAMQYEASSVTSSYYMDMRSVLKLAVDMQDWEFSIPLKVMNDIKNGVIVKSKPLTSFSIREMTNFFWSYCVVEKNGKFVIDHKLLDKLMSDLLSENSSKASKTHKSMQALAVKGHKHLPRLDKEDVLEFIRDVFTRTEENMGLEGEVEMPIPDRGWNRMDAGLAKLSDEDFAYKWKQVMNGHKKWPGLGGDGFVIVIDGQDFFIPGYRFLKSSILPIDKQTWSEDNPECMFGDTMQTVFMLLFAIRNDANGKEVNWHFNAAQHLIRTNASLLEDRYNRMSVKGTYLTIAPKFWNCNQDDYIHSVVAMGAKEGHMSYSKDPVLFDKAVTGVVNSHDLPEDMFSELYESDVFAMQSVAFVNVPLLLNQENDSDGDLCCLRYNLKLPLYTGPWKYLKKRVDFYYEGERDYNMVMKPWKFYGKEELAIGIDSNKTAKENIGLMSSGLFRHAMMLEYAIQNGGMNIFFAKLMWNLYGYIVQDEAMRMIKHSGGSVAESGRSAYYESTSTLMAVQGSADIMFCGRDLKEDEMNGVKTVDESDPDEANEGFLQRIGDYWEDFDPNNTRHAGALRKACLDYVAMVRKLCYSHYTEVHKYPVSGHITGMLSGATAKPIYHAMDIGNRKCNNSQFKLFNVLQRGYFRNTEANRLGKGLATYASNVFAQFEVPTPSNGWDVAIGIKTLRQQEVRVPAVATMSLAFQLDAVVRRGWFVQHNYIGRLNIRVGDNDTCVLKWVEMVGRAVAVEEKLQQKKEEQKILRAMKAMESEPEEVIYPDLSDWGDDQS